MTQSSSTPMCTLVWPSITVSDSSDVDHWVVGWNPRGLVVVIATVVDGATIEDAKAAIEEKRPLLPPSLARGLRIIGRFRSLHSPGSDESGARQMRLNADIWMELSDGPSLVELFCCGYKYLPELHVVHCDAHCRKFQTTPYSASALSRLGIHGLDRVLHDTKPLIGSSARSVLEGPVLPSHCVQLFRSAVAARNPISPIGGNQSGTALDLADGASFSSPAPTASAAVAASSAGGATVGGGAMGHGITDDANMSIGSAQQFPPSVGMSPAKPMQSSLHDESFTLESVVAAAAELRESTGMPPTPQKSGTSKHQPPPRLEPLPQQSPDSVIVKGTPPRLDYPMAENTTELSVILQCCNAGVQLRLGKSAKAEPATREPPYLVRKLCGFLIGVLQLLLRVVSILTGVSYVFRMLDFRARECINWLSLIGGASQSCGLHPLVPHVLDSSCTATARRGCLIGFVFRIAADVTLGVLMSMALVVWKDAFVSWVRAVGWFGLYELHMGYVAWFVGWPGGFKMNDDLNLVLSYVTQRVLVAWKDVVMYRPDIDWIDISYTVLVAISLAGASFALSFVADCCNVATLHLRNSFHLMSVLYRGFVQTMSCLVQQFRGRKFNALRNRLDAQEYSVDQMLIGTLLFTAIMFLFPTLALYYFYLAVVRTSVWIVQEALSAVGHACCYIPVFQLLQWVTHRHSLPSGVELVEPRVRRSSRVESGSPHTPSQRTVDITLKTRPMPLASVFVDLAVAVWIVTRAFVPRRILSFILWSEEKPAVNASARLFPHLFADSVSPPLTLLSK